MWLTCGTLRQSNQSPTGWPCTSTCYHQPLKKKKKNKSRFLPFNNKTNKKNYNREIFKKMMSESMAKFQQMTIDSKFFRDNRHRDDCSLLLSFQWWTVERDQCFRFLWCCFFFLPSLLLFHWRYSTPVQRPASIDLPAPIAGVSRFKMKLHNSMKMQHVTLLIYVIAQTERERENTALIRKSEARIFWGIFRFSFSEFDCSIHTSI